MSLRQYVDVNSLLQEHEDERRIDKQREDMERKESGISYPDLYEGSEDKTNIGWRRPAYLVDGKALDNRKIIATQCLLDLVLTFFLKAFSVSRLLQRGSTHLESVRWLAINSTFRLSSSPVSKNSIKPV